MPKRVCIWMCSAIAILMVLAAGRYVRRAHWPVDVEPSPDWELTLNELHVDREQFFVRNGEHLLEADLLIPRGGAKQKSAVIFSPGSGDALYQNYARGLIRTYVMDVFLPRDVAVLLMNKRGMGKSDGNWMKSDFQGRADDLYAGVQYLQNHQAIAPDRIGLIGHSQGGWIVNLTASQHQDVAFFISLVGPTTTVREQIEDTYENELLCEGYHGDDLARRTHRRMMLTQFGTLVGRVTSFGAFGFDARIMEYDPREALRTVQCPGLFIFGEYDRLVPAKANSDRFQAIFEDHPPRHLTVATLRKANHCFRVTDGFCSEAGDSADYPLSSELVTVLNNWLSEIGF